MTIKISLHEREIQKQLFVELYEIREIHEHEGEGRLTQVILRKHWPVSFVRPTTYNV